MNRRNPFRFLLGTRRPRRVVHVVFFRARRARGVLLASACLWGAGWLGGAEFRAAVVEIDITPKTPQMLRGHAPRMSTGVHDRIFHRIVSFDDGTQSFYLLSSDLSSLSPAYSDQVTNDLARQLGVPPENVWWTITHNHSSPYVVPPGIPGVLMPGRFQFQADEAYTALVAKTLLDGVLEAKPPPISGLPVGRVQSEHSKHTKRVDGAQRSQHGPSVVQSKGLKGQFNNFQ